jgi:anti-sigma factor RsiW
VKHSQIRARLSEYLERDLTSEERSRIGAHVAGCSECERELRELSATVSLLRRLPEPALPPGIGNAVMARIARGEGREARVRSLFRRAAEPRFAAPLAAGLAGLFFLFQAVDPERETPPQPGRQAYSDEFPLVASTGFAAARAGVENGWSGSRDAANGAFAGVSSDFTPAAAYRQYVSQVRREEARRRDRIEEVARLLRGAGHPNSASLASNFEASAPVVLADWQPR